ncbi:DNA internalization-related competence protein ComEC/Rec2 [candidate division KSB1 bacterium]|nr:DNA internalization-related competence protein ComEC/Rec2 [candidate division KSB1 bacterium]
MMNRTKIADLPAIKFLFLYAAGILIAHQVNLSSAILLLLPPIIFIASIVCFCVKKLKSSFITIWIMITLIITGFLRFTYTDRLIPHNHIAHMVQKNDSVSLEGKIKDYPAIKDSVTTFLMSVSKLRLSDTISIPINGDILVKCWFENLEIRFNDMIRASGKVRLPRGERNPGEFDYRSHLKSIGIYQMIYVYHPNDLVILQKREHRHPLQHTISGTREYIDKNFKRYFLDQERAIIKGLILGDRSEINPELKAAFSASGVMHVLAVSGLHVGFVVMIITGIVKFIRIPYNWKQIVIILCVFTYMQLIGFKAPVIRASTIVMLYLIGKLLQRKTNTINLLATAALIILIIDPRQLFQASFQLSFAAVLSILFIYQRMNAFINTIAWFTRIRNSKIIGYIFDIFLVSLAVSVGTAPLTMYYFEKLPIISLLLNIVVVPLVGVIIASGFLFILLTLVSSTCASMMAHLISLLLRFLIASVKSSAAMHFGYIEIFSIGLAHVFGLYLFILLLLNIRNPKYFKVMIFYLLIVLNILSWQALFRHKDYLEVIYFDVGQGDGALIKTPDNRYALIDGGDAYKGHSSGQRFIYPYLRRNGIRQLDYVILTHGDNDHVGGLPFLLRHIKVSSVIDNGITAESEIYADYLKVIDSLKIDHKILKAGAEIDFGQDIACFVLHPAAGMHVDDLNNSSLVLKLVYKNVQFLFTGDIEAESEQTLLRYGDLLKCDILKVAHHGSKSSSIQDFLDYSKPVHAVISVGEYNRFRQPSSQVLSRLNRSDIHVYRTDLSGAIIFRSDGKKLWQFHWRGE